MSAALSAQEQRLKPLELTFPIPSMEAFRLDLTEREARLLIIKAIEASNHGGVRETPSASRVTASGTVPAGARSVTFITSGASPAMGNGVNFTGSILGVSRLAGESLTIEAQAGNTLGAIAYVVTTGSLDIIKTV